MKKIIPIFLLCIFVFGCDYTVPVIKSPGLKIDRDIIDLWTRPGGNGDTERLAVLPLSEREYLISFTGQGGESLYARGWTFRLGNLELVQIEWLGTSEGEPPETDRVFQYCSWSLEADTLEVRLINPEAVDKNIKSREALKAAIKNAQDSPDLFKKPMLFEKKAP